LNRRNREGYLYGLPAPFRESAVFFQQIPERLIGEFLKILHAISRQKIESMPSLVFELDAFAGHRSSSPFSEPTRSSAPAFP
jgi:hypothetical protein